MDTLKLDGKKGIILGVRTKRSIAWAAFKSLYDAGAEIMLTYEKDDMLPTMEKLTKDIEGVLFSKCDILNNDDIDRTIKLAEEKFGKIDFVLHSIAYAAPESLQNPFSYVTKDQYNLAHNISAYSLIPLTAKAATIMNENGSVVAMTYLGGERVVKNYNLMGVAKASLECISRYLADEFGEKQIRVNTISAGPIRTPAARGIPEFQRLYDDIENRAPLKRNVSVDEVGKAVLFLCSDFSTGISAENIHVDCGFHAMGS